MTREEAIVKFRQMWNIIAEIPEEKWKVLAILSIKRRALKEIGEKEEIKDNCYCCEYDEQENGTCMSCPIDWGIDGYRACCRSMYGDWRTAVYNKKYEEAKRIAKIISNLPEVERTA